MRRRHQVSRTEEGRNFVFRSRIASAKPAKRKSVSTLVVRSILGSPISLVGAAMLLIGGALSLGLFVRHGYLPDADLASSTAILFAVAIVGLMIGLLLAFVFVVPGIATRALAEETSIGVDATCWVIIVAPTPVFLLLVMFGPYFEPLNVSGATALLLSFAASPISLAALLGRGWIADVIASPNRRECLKRRGVQALALCLAGLIWLVASTAVLRFSLSVASDVEKNPWLALLVSVAWLSLVVGVNIAIVRIPLFRVWKIAPIAGLGVLIVLLAFTGNFSVISAVAFRSLGLGEVGPIALTVTGPACDALNRGNHKGLHCTTRAGEQGGTIENVRLLSRLGGQFLIEAAVAERERSGAETGEAREQRLAEGAKKAEGVHRAVIRKEDVVLWVFSDRSR